MRHLYKNIILLYNNKNKFKIYIYKNIYCKKINKYIVFYLEQSYK